MALGTHTSARVVLLAVAVLVSALALTPDQAGAAVPEPRFGPEIAHPGNTGKALAVADFTGDGLADVATTSGWSPDVTLAYKLYLYAQGAGGGLEERARLDTSQTEEMRINGGLATADFDADGRVDLAVPTGVGIDIFVPRNGTLVRHSVLELPGARQVEAADVDRDGRSDLVVTGAAGVSLLRATGAGTFAAPVSITTRDHAEIDVGDVTGDGRLDVVGYTHREGDRSRMLLHVFRQLDSGTFDAGREYSTTGEALALGDFTGDGRNDVAQVVTGNRPGSGLTVFPQRSDGSLGPAVYYPAYDIPDALEAADVNGDGRLDLVTLHDAWFRAGVFVQEDNGTMAAERLYATEYGNYEVNSLAVVDFTGDHRPDIVSVGAGGIRLLPGLPPGPAPTTTTSSVPPTTATTRPPSSTTTTTAPQPTGGQTTAFQIDAAHSGSLRGGPERPPLTKRWSVDLGGAVGFPLIADGTVFAVANTAHSYSQSTLYAFDAATGRTAWGPLDLGRLATYTYGAGQIFVVNSDGTVRSFDARTGRMRWMTRITSQHLFDAPPVYHDGLVYFAGYGSGGTLYALSAGDGREVWTGHLPDGYNSAPAAGEDLVYTSHACAPAVAWGATTGQLTWGRGTGCSGSPQNYTPALSNGLLWVRGTPSRLPGAVDARTGEQVVTFTADVAPAFDGPDGFFLADGVLEARDARTQTTRWSFAGDGRLTSAPIVVNGFVYTASESGQVWALDGRTGEVAWSDNAGAPVLPPGEIQGFVRRPMTGLGAGQGVVVVPASNLLVAYAPQGSTPAATAAPPPRALTSGGATATPATRAGHFRIDPSGRGWVLGGPGAPPLQTQWSRELGAATEYAVSGAGKVFVGAGTRLLGLDPATGEDAWPPFTFPSAFPASQFLRVAYGDGRVFAVPNEGAVRAFDATTGRQLWSRELKQSYGSGPTYSRGIVYVVVNGSTVALSAATGRELWNNGIGQSAGSPPAVSGDVLYPSAPCVRATDAFTGAQKWESGYGPQCDLQWAGTPVVADGQMWQEGTGLVTPLVRDTATGKVTGGFGGTMPAFDSTRAYVLDGYAVKAKDPLTQFTLWTFAPEDQVATPPVVVDGHVYVASRSGRVWALNPATGQPVWEGETGATIPYPYNVTSISTSITAAPGLVLVPAGHRLVAFGAVTPAKPEPSPHPAAFGLNIYGELGDGTATARPSVVASGLTDAVEVSAGAYHTLSRRADGTVWAAGWNEFGQLGDGSKTSRATPVQVRGLTDVVSVSAGLAHSMAVTADGSVWTWGWNVLGQLGDGTTTDRSTPVRVTGLAGVASVSGGVAHSAAVGGDGSLWTWGWNGVGQLGLGSTTDRLRPTAVPGLRGVSTVAAGWHHTVAVKADGTVWSWGWNHVGQLGDGTTVDRHSPVQVPGLSNVVAAAAGVYHGLAVHDDGTVSAWGWNGLGQVGDGTLLSRLSPVKVAGIRDATNVAAGTFHSLARLTDGAVLSWGWNGGGQLGDGTLSDRARPASVAGLAGATSIAAGVAHSVVVRRR